MDYKIKYTSLYKDFLNIIFLDKFAIFNEYVLEL